jgi:hypothetical protein
MNLSKVVRIEPSTLEKIWVYKIHGKFRTLSDAIDHAIEKSKGGPTE